MKCFICEKSCEGVFNNIHEPVFRCPQCGNYSITDVAMNIIKAKKYPNWQNQLKRFIATDQNPNIVQITTGTIKTIFGY